MRMICARQVWGEAFHVRTSSTLASATEILRMGCRVQTTVRSNNNDLVAHHVECGKIQAAIATLPEELQKLGHWLYSPLTTEQLNMIVDDVHDLIFAKSGLSASNKKTGQARYWMTRAVMKDYQDIVLGRERTLTKPGEIRKHLADWHGIKITDRWVRDWEPVWQKLFHALNDLDAEALRPVSAVIHTQMQAA